MVTGLFHLCYAQKAELLLKTTFIVFLYIDTPGTTVPSTELELHTLAFITHTKLSVKLGSLKSCFLIRQ